MRFPCDALTIAEVRNKRTCNVINVSADFERIVAHPSMSSIRPLLLSNVRVGGDTANSRSKGYNP